MKPPKTESGANLETTQLLAVFARRRFRYCVDQFRRQAAAISVRPECPLS